MKNTSLIALRVSIVALLFGALLVQAVIIPAVAYAVSSDAPEFAYLAVPYVAAAIAGIACAQVVLVATWKLTLLVGREAIFDASSLRWVTLMVRAAAVATALTAVVAIQVALNEQLGPVTVPIALFGCMFGAGAFWLVLIILRGLLEAAVAHKVELDEVV